MPIDQIMEAAVANQIAKNREKLHPIIKTILLYGRQNVALEGIEKMKTLKLQAISKYLLIFVLIVVTQFFRIILLLPQRQQHIVLKQYKMK